MPIFSYIEDILPETFGKTDKLGQIYKQTTWTFCTSNDVALQVNVFRRTHFSFVVAMRISFIIKVFVYKSVKVHTS